jgi:hypothetical protein
MQRLAGNWPFSRKSFLWTTGLLLLIVTTTGCPRIASIDYQPSNPLKGQGTVGTAPFRYQPSDDHRVRPRQVETDPGSKNKLYLAQEIGVFFADALRKELQRSGYRLEERSDPVVSGTVTRFYLDWKSEQDRSFELAADYVVRSGERALFTWHCTSLQRGPNMLAEDGILIREGIADCMHRFIAAAQEATAF